MLELISRLKKNKAIDSERVGEGIWKRLCMSLLKK